MVSNLDKYKTDLERLVKLGTSMALDLTSRTLGSTESLGDEIKEALTGVEGSFESHYQRWYTEASEVIRQLIPRRIEEFETLYRGEVRRKGIGIATFAIQDWLNGVRAATRITGEKHFSDFSIVLMRFKNST